MPDKMDLITALRMYEELKTIKEKYDELKFNIDKDFFFEFVDVLLQDRDRLLVRIDDLIEELSETQNEFQERCQ